LLYHEWNGREKEHLKQTTKRVVAHKHSNSNDGIELKYIERSAAKSEKETSIILNFNGNK